MVAKDEENAARTSVPIRHSAGSHALTPPLHRNNRSPFSPAPATPEPPFEVENLDRGAHPARTSAWAVGSATCWREGKKTVVRASLLTM